MKWQLLAIGLLAAAAPAWALPPAALTGPPLRHDSPVIWIEYSPDGRALACGSTDGTVRLWDAGTHKQIGAVPLASIVYGVAFTPDGKRLACGCADNTIRLVDVDSLTEVAELRGHEAYVHAVAFSSDGKRLVSGSGDFTVRLWDSVPLQTRIQSVGQTQP